MAETGGPNDPGSSRPGVAGRVARRRQVAHSPRRKANSSPPRPATTWAASPGRSPSSSASASTTSTGYTRPVQRRPAWARTVLAGPSQPQRSRTWPPPIRPAYAGSPGHRRVRRRTAASSVPRSTSTPRSSSACASTRSTSICRTSVRCGKAVSGSARPPNSTRITRAPSRRSAAGAVSARASSACVTPSGRSTSNVRACRMSAREGRVASGRRSTTRTTAPWSCACRARASPAGPAPATRMSAVSRRRSAATRPRPRPAGAAGRAPRYGAARAAPRSGSSPAPTPGRAPAIGPARSSRLGAGCPTPAGPGSAPGCRGPATAWIRTRKPANSGVLSRLSRRNAACPMPRTARSRNSTRSTHGSSVAPRSATVSRYTRAEVPSAKCSSVPTRWAGRRSRCCRSSRAVLAEQRATARSAVR